MRRDTALAFIALDHDQQREKAITQETDFANTLINIVQRRLDAGEGTQIDLTQAKLTAAQSHVAAMKADDDVQYDREHLGHLIDLPAASLSIDGGFPPAPLPDETAQPTSTGGYVNAAVAAAFATADARRQQAAGQARFRFWPEINLVAQYNRYATFTDSFAQLQKIDTINGRTALTANEGAFGIQITLPVMDKERAAKAREAAAQAAKLFHDAQTAQLDALDGASHLRRSISEMRAQAEVDSLQQQLAQQQLDITRLQLQSGNGNPASPQLSPAEEQKALIAERDIALIDANFQMRQAEIQLLRQTGDLETWLKSSTPATQH